MKKVYMVIVAVAGLLLLGVAVYYWITPAGSLLHIIPGYQAGVTAPHTKHAIGAFILAIGCGVLLWFLSGSKHEAASEPPVEE